MCSYVYESFHGMKRKGDKIVIVMIALCTGLLLPQGVMNEVGDTASCTYGA